MSAMVTIVADGVEISAPAGTSVAAALLNVDLQAFRRSTTSEPRGPLCGMGICYECRVTIDGRPHQRACLLTVAEGMRIVTSEGNSV